MKIIETLSEPIGASTVLTIGNFDGVHLGHQAILNRLLQIANQEGKQSAVLTFANHPSEVLRPEKPVSRLCKLPHRLAPFRTSWSRYSCSSNIHEGIFAADSSGIFAAYSPGSFLFSLAFGA